MGEHGELVEQLRRFPSVGDDLWEELSESEQHWLMEDQEVWHHRQLLAAGTIEALTARVDKLEAALHEIASWNDYHALECAVIAADALLSGEPDGELTDPVDV